MLKNMHLVVLEDESEVDSMMKLAANCDLKALYKIGVYGKERQHELFVSGYFWNYWHFMDKIKAKKKIKGS